MATKRKVRWHIAIPLGICALLVVYLIVALVVSLFTRKPEPNVYTICSYTGSQTLKKINEEDKTNVVEVKDFNYYGENLNLYLQVYDIAMDETAKASGDTLILVDQCTGTETRFAISGLADSGIALGKLDAGFYAVYLQQGSTKQRVYMSSTLASEGAMTLVSRNGSRKKVELLANQKLFDQPDQVTPTLDNSYLYIKISAETAEEAAVSTVYDVAINTAPYIVSTADTKKPAGLTQNGINQAAETYQTALNLKAELEKAGLKVIILKAEAADATPFYGVDGILQAAYNSSAKYLINLDFAQLELGCQVLYSQYSSDSLAESIQQALTSTGVNMNKQPIKAGDSNKDYTYDRDGKPIPYDEFYEIREAGGRQLLAGVISENSRRNENFASGSAFGMQAVTINLISINNADEVKYYNANKELLAAQIAQGLINYLNN
jgi:hypothetical protein